MRWMSVNKARARCLHRFRGVAVSVMLMLPPATRAEDAATIPARHTSSDPHEPRRILAGAGAVTFGATYLATVVVGGLATLGSAGHRPERFHPLFIPVVGPFMTVSRTDQDKKLWLASGGLQIAGLALLATGLLLPSEDAQPARLSWTVSASPGQVGLRAGGSF